MFLSFFISFFVIFFVSELESDESGLELENDVFKKDYPQVKIVYYEDISQYQPPPLLFINKYNFISELSEDIEQHFPKIIK